MTLSQYQNMIKHAKEIQKEWIPKIGDEILKNDKYLCTIKQIFKYSPDNHENLIWIPTYDDLMDLIPINDYNTKIFYINENMNDAKACITDNRREIVLRVIMYKFHNKLWNFEKKCWSQYNWD